MKRIDPHYLKHMLEGIFFRYLNGIEARGIDEHDIVVATFAIGELDNANIGCARFEFMPNINFHPGSRSNKLPVVRKFTIN